MDFLKSLQEITKTNTLGQAEETVPPPDILSLTLDSQELKDWFCEISLSLKEEARKGESSFEIWVQRTQNQGYQSDWPTYLLATRSMYSSEPRWSNLTKLVFPKQFHEWDYNAKKAAGKYNISAEAKHMITERRNNFFEDSLQHLISMWNKCPDYQGLLCTRSTKSEYTAGSYNSSSSTKNYIGLRWDWTQTDGAGIDTLRKKVEKRHRDWKEARNDLESALKVQK